MQLTSVVGNRYRILSLLGSGGMGHVYLARDELLGRDVALKVLKEPYADEEEFVERFRREARNAASLSHPNIVPVYDMGKAEDGTPYIAMEYMAGGTLGELMAREGALDAPKAAAIARQIARALGEAHRRNVIHRDVKPHNVFLTGKRLDALGTVKVGDFGIARAAEASTLTEENLILGTARYLSPEQAKGEHVGPRSDLYSLGVVLYEMLTGRVPFDAENPADVVMKHVSEPPPSPKEANPEVPEGMDAVVLRLLSKDPEDRHEDAAELIRDLERVQAGLPQALPLEKPAGTLTGRGETKEAATAALGDTYGKPQQPREERAGMPSGAVVYGRGQKLRQISPRTLLAVSVVILAMLLGTVGWKLTQAPTGQASVAPLQDTAEASADASQGTPGETETAASGSGSADGKEAKAPSAGGSPQGKASSYIASPGNAAKQSSSPGQVAAVSAALTTQDTAAPQATPASSTSQADVATSSSEQSSQSTSQHVVVTTNSQNSVGSEETTTKKRKK